jgi:fructokinase
MKPKLVGIGELLWDMLPDGPQLGGAPANFAYHACALGAEARVISRVGRDDLGHELIRRLERLGVHSDCVEVDLSSPTSTVTVEVDPAGEPRFTIRESVAWDNLRAESAGRLAVSLADAVCFGTLAQRLEPSRSSIRSLVRTAPPSALRILDVNLRQHYYSPPLIAESLELANVLKLNETELPRLAEMFAVTGDERSQISQLAQRHQLRVVAYTRGARGSLLLADGRWSDDPGVSANVVDTVGAGDSFTAAIALGLLAGWDLDRINHLANEVASFVASSAGATPELPLHLRSPFLARFTTGIPPIFV